RLSTGILMFTLASSLCEQVHLYGFWPFGWDPNTGKELPYHYYDKKGTKFTTKWQDSNCSSRCTQTASSNSASHTAPE
ncbi:hypothetical protein M9458_042829, partial [Cirrhinus mrigala]